MKSKRRLLLKALAAGGSTASITHLPSKWVRPVVDAVAIPAHAQTTPADAQPTNVLLSSCEGARNSVSSFTGTIEAAITTSGNYVQIFDFPAPGEICLKGLELLIAYCDGTVGVQIFTGQNGSWPDMVLEDSIAGISIHQDDSINFDFTQAANEVTVTGPISLAVVVSHSANCYPYGGAATGETFAVTSCPGAPDQSCMSHQTSRALAATLFYSSNG